MAFFPAILVFSVLFICFSKKILGDDEGLYEDYKAAKRAAKRLSNSQSHATYPGMEDESLQRLAALSRKH